MAADNIQFRLHFITDESEALANTHKKIKELNGSIYEQENSIKKLETEYQKLEKITDRTAEDEAKMVKIKDDIVEKNKKIAESIREIAVSSKDISKLDLSKVTQSQLTSIAKQIDLQRKFLAQSSDEYQTLTANLKLVNDQLAKVNASTRGVAVAATTAKVDSFFKDAFSVFLGGGLLQAVTAVGSAILSFGKSSISAAADMETLGVSLEVILGSADKAKEALDFAKGYASSTPFELPGINEAILKLSSYGFELEDIKKELPKIGDIASGVGVPIEELAAIFGKAKLSNFIQAEELNQLADRGIPVFESLARQIDRKSVV